MMNKKFNEYSYVVFRLIVGVLFLLHGLSKFGVLGGEAKPLMSLMGAAGVIEVVVGILLTLGAFVCIASSVAAIEMIVAYFMVHAPQGMNPLSNGGEPALLFFAAFLVLIAHGSGKLSVEKLWK